jgi:multiple sugar transport system substrate-binding protein
MRRRAFLLAAAAGAGAAVVAACAPAAAPTATTAPKAAEPAKPAEAPKPAEAAKPTEVPKPAAASPAAPAKPTEAPAQATPLMAAPTVVTKPQSELPGPEKAKIDWKQFKGTSIKWIGGLHPISETLIKMAPEFEELTGIKVTVEQIAWETFMQKFQLDLSSKDPQYDTAMSYFALDWKHGSAGLLADLDPMINDPKLTDKEWLDMQDISPGLLASARWDGVPGHRIGTGKIYSVPYIVETYILGYRADLFDKYNLKVPKTVEEVVPAAKAIAEGEKANGTAGFAVRGDLGQAPITAVWMSLLPNYGGGDFDDKMNSRVAEDANVQFSDLLINKIIKPYGPPGWTGLTWDDLRKKFANGDFGMVYDCDFFSLLYEDPKESKVAGKLKYANLGGPQGMQSSTFYFGNQINKNSKNQGAAWLFHEWLLSKRVMRDFTVKYRNLIPTRLSTWADPDVQKMVGGWGGGSWLEATRANLEKYAKLALTPNSELPAVCDKWMGANQKIYSGAAVKPTLMEAEKEINGIMDKAGIRKK